MAGAVEPHLERRQLDDDVLAGEDALEIRSRSSGRIDARKPTRPKLTPITGHVAAEQLRERAQHRPVAAEHDGDLRLAGVVDEPRRPRCVATSRTRPTAASTSTRPCVTTAAVLTGRDRCVDPLVEVIGKRRVVGLREVEEELPVALRAGEPGVYDADDACPPAERSRRRSRAARARERRVADDAALADVRAAGLELRLDEHDRLPAGRGEPQAPAAARSAPR